MRKIILLFITVAILLISLSGFILYNNQNNPNLDNDKTIVLESVEINEYEGEKLSSTKDFRENSIRGPQHIDIEDYTLKITGLVKDSKSYSYDEILQNNNNYKKTVTLHCVEGWSVNILWEGVMIKELFKEAEPLPEAKIIIFHASDGYTTSLPIEYIIENDIMIAYKMNNITLPPERGFPFQLVAESKWGYKWIKWVTEIEFSDDINYKGFWESRGYSNEADLDKNFYS